ncbi:hypothetical protein AMTRI_Chr01g127050 [Amborella trichopoda]
MKTDPSENKTQNGNIGTIHPKLPTLHAYTLQTQGICLGKQKGSTQQDAREN